MKDTKGVRPAENKFLWRDCLYTAFHTSYVHRRGSRGLERSFSPARLVRNLWIVVARLFNIQLRKTFPLSRHAAENIRRSEGKPYVLHVICNMEIGGSQKIILDLFEHMSDRYKMKILTGHVPFYVTYPGLPVTVLNTAGEIAGFLRQERPHVVHFHYWGLDGWMKMFLETAFALKGEIGYAILENSNNPVPVYADPAIDHYAHVSQFVIDLQPEPPSIHKHSVVYPGVDPGVFSFSDKRVDPLTAGMVYRLTNDKISKNTIELLIRICRAVPEILIYVIGDGPNLKHFIQRSRAASVRNNIFFTGFVSYEDLPGYYEKFNLFLAPVHHESYGVVMPYAMFKGNPIVAFDVDAVEELLSPNQRVVKTRDEFVRAVVSLLNDSEDTGNAVRRSRAVAEKRFSLQGMVENYDGLYRRLMRRAALPATGAGPKDILLHVDVTGQEFPYFSELFGYSRDIEGDPGLVARVLADFKSRVDGVGPGYAAYRHTTFAASDDADVLSLLKTMRALLRSDGDARISLLFVSRGNKARLCHLYPTIDTGGDTALELFPPPVEMRHLHEISVCIPTYNRVAVLEKCLRTLNEDYRLLLARHPHLGGRIEVLVIDDASTDGTLSALEKLRDELDFTLAVSTIPNSGPATARNKAVSLATGRVILFIDDDKIVEHGFLARHYEYHREHPEDFSAAVGFVDWPPYLEKNFLMNHVVSEHGGQQFGFCVIDRHDPQALPCDYFVTANLSLKRRLLSIFGGFHARIFRDAMWEDIELGWRMMELGLKLRYLPDAIVYHDHSMYLPGFLARQYKVGKCVAQNKHYTFFAPRRIDVEDYLRSADHCHYLFSHLGLGELLAISHAIADNERELLRVFGDAKMHEVYRTILSAAYIYGYSGREAAAAPAELSPAQTALHLAFLFSDAVASEESSLFYDTGNGFRTTQVVRRSVRLNDRTLDITFALPRTAGIRALRWDPVNANPCRVRLREITISSSGKETRLDPATFRCNGHGTSSGWIEFATLDPRVVIRNVPQEPDSIRFVGEWELMAAKASLPRLESTVHKLESAVHRLQTQNAALAAELAMMKGSYSWRMTRVLRQVLSALASVTGTRDAGAARPAATPRRRT